jgi:glycosyltransferase involved in cell wall biosynthesis
VTESLRILQLYPKSDYFTGAAIQLLELARGLQGRGHRVVVATRAGGAWAEKCAEARLPYYAVPMRSELDIGSVAPLVRILREHRIQVVHAQKGRARTLALMASLFTRIPVLVLNRGVSFPLERLGRLGYTTKRVAAIVAVSESIKRGLVAKGVRSDKIHVIHSGTDTSRFHPGVDGARVRWELGLGPEHFLITQVGIRSRKGNDDTLEAMRIVAMKAPHARLLFVGANEVKARIYREKATARGLAERMLILLYREDIPEILAASDVCVDASYEGLGLTGSLRESLAVQTPVIGSDIQGNPELIIDGETGYLFPPRDVDALARAILRLMENPDQARAMARAGRQRVESEFSIAAKIDRTEALYRRLLAARRRP